MSEVNKSEITVEQLSAKVDQWHEKKAQVKELEEQTSKLNNELNEIGWELINWMDALGIEKFEGKLGKIRIQTDEYVNMPDDEFKKAEFVNYLKELGEWDGFATIHHHKLQSWYKSKMEEHGPLFMAPGLDQPKTRKSIRKSR